jgi:photosystem II stability/assembly factor-like uncharacterized protein
MKKLVLALVLLGVVFSNNYSFSANKFQTLLQSNKEPNFYDIQKALNEDYNSNNPSVRRGWKQFKRWEYFWGQRVFPTGEFPNTYKIYESVQKFEKVNSNPQIQSSNIWKALGPFNPPTASDNEEGIGRINIIRFNPNNENDLWIGAASGGVWRSKDGGTTWINYPFTNFLSLGVSDIAIAPSNVSTVYVTTGDADGSIGTAGSYYTIGIIKTTDDGATWSVTNFAKQLSDKKILTRILVSPTDENIVLVGTSDGIYKTTDGGQTWVNKYAYNSIVDMEYKPGDPNIVYAASYGYSGKNDVLKSTDNGETWKSIYSVTSSNRLSIEVTPADPNSIYCLASNSSTSGFLSFSVSQDEGATWTVTATPSTVNNILGWYNGQGSDNKGQGMYDLSLAVSPKDPYTVLIGGIDIWKTPDLGYSVSMLTHWFGYYSKPYVHADIHDLRFSPSGSRIYAVCDGGIYMSKNNGISWQDISNGLNITQFYRLGSSDLSPDVIVAGAQDNGTSALINGQWKHIYSADGMEAVVDPTNSNRIYVSIYYGTFYRTNNGGSSFAKIIDNSITNENGGWVTPFVLDPSNPNTVYCGFQNVWRNKVNGEISQWQKISSFGSSQTLVALAVAPSDPNTLYAANYTDIYATRDGGNTWSNIYHSNSSAITYIAVDPNNAKRIWFTKSGFGSSDKVYEINDDNLLNLSGNLPNVPVNTIVYQKNSPDRLYIGTDIGVFYSDYESGYWERFGDGLPNVIVQELEIDYGQSIKLRAATYGRGIWETNVLDCNLPAPQVNVIGKVELCEGDSTTLQIGGDYSNFQWSNGSTDKTITVSTPGIYSLIVTSPDGCKAKSQGVEIKVYPKKSITITSATGSLAFCGDETQLELRASLGFQSYLWSTGDTVRRITVTEPGDYYVTGITTQGCSSTSDKITIVKSSLPPKPIIKREGNTLTVSVDDPNFDLSAMTFKWYLYGVLLPDATGQSITLTNPSELGNYTVEIYNQSGCSTKSDVFAVDELPVKENASINSSITISPNPNDGNFDIQLSNVNSGNAQIVVEDVNGRKVLSKDMLIQDASAIPMNLSNLSNGVYFIKININNKTFIEKFIKQ